MLEVVVVLLALVVSVLGTTMMARGIGHPDEDDADTWADSRTIGNDWVYVGRYCIARRRGEAV